MIQSSVSRRSSRWTWSVNLGWLVELLIESQSSRCHVVVPSLTINVVLIFSGFKVCVDFSLQLEGVINKATWHISDQLEVLTSRRVDDLLKHRQFSPNIHALISQDGVRN